jgi:hypothetical protein
MTYALRGCSHALLTGWKSALASCLQVAAGGDRWLLMAVRGHLGGTPVMRRPDAWMSGATRLSAFRPDISSVGADRPSVMRCRRSLLTAVGCCCCCHRCCQRLVVFPSPWSPRRCGSALSFPGPPPNPIAAGLDGRRVLSRVGVADHVVTPEAPWTGSGCREYSYGGFGGGHPHFLPHAPDLPEKWRLAGRAAAGPGYLGWSGRCERGIDLVAWAGLVSSGPASGRQRVTSKPRLPSLPT